MNAFEAIGESERAYHFASNKPLTQVIARRAAIRGPLVRRCIQSLLALCSIVLVTATAKGAELPAAMPNAAGPMGGWWSPETADVPTAPQLQVGMAQLTRFGASDSFPTSPAEPTSYLTIPSAASIASLRYFGLTLNANVAKQALLANPVSLPPRSLVSLLQTKYAVWESSLSDSRSLTYVNGASVYPLLQINYAGEDLPVTLYISPLRGSGAQ